MCILPSRQEREMLFEATRTCVWLELDVCRMCVRFAAQQRDTSGLINHLVPVVQRLVNAIQWINRYPAGKC